jgi:hypothetical protein
MLLWLWPEDPFWSSSMNSVIYHVSGDDSHQVWSQLQRIYLNNASIKLVIGLSRVFLLIFPTCVLSHQALCFWLVPFLQLLVQKFPAVTVVAFQFEVEDALILLVCNFWFTCSQDPFFNKLFMFFILGLEASCDCHSKSCNLCYSCQVHKHFLLTPSLVGDIHLKVSHWGISTEPDFMKPCFQQLYHRLDCS